MKQFYKGQVVRIIKATNHWGISRQPPLNSVLQIAYVSDLPLHHVYFDTYLHLISAPEELELVTDLTILEKVIYGLKID